MGLHSDKEIDYDRFLRYNFEKVDRNYDGMAGGLEGWTVEDENEAEYHVSLDGDSLILQYTFDLFT